MPEDFITHVMIEHEGGEKATNRPNDAGGRTQYGISEKDNPEAWADGKVTEDEARAIYQKKYLLGPGFDKVSYIPLQNQLVDFGVHSGPGTAIMKLQSILGNKQDGILGPLDLAKLAGRDLRVVNNLLAIERIKMLGRIVSKKPNQLENLNGWLNRATEFII